MIINVWRQVSVLVLTLKTTKNDEKKDSFGSTTENTAPN